MSKFEQQKEEIRSSLTDIIFDLQIALNDIDLNNQIINKLDYINNQINRLQPEFPTCATCKSFIQELSNTGSCKKGIGYDYIQFVDGVNPIVFIDFGCLHHSDYDKAANK